MSESKMVLSIIIEGDSAEELFAVGPNDLKEFFLPNGLKVKKSDVTQVAFEKVTARHDFGFPIKTIIHQDNFYRGRT